MRTAIIQNRDQELAASGTIPELSAANAGRTGHQLAGTRTSPSTGADQPRAANTTAAAEVSAADGFLFELATAALYHRSRVTWFAALHRVGMFLNILFGTAAVAFIKNDPTVSVVMTLILAVVTSGNLAFDFPGLARKHEDARRNYHDLAAELEESSGDDSTVKRLRARMIRAAGTEPVMFEAAEKVAFNAAIRSLGRDPNDEWILKWHQRFFRHIWPFSRN